MPFAILSMIGNDVNAAMVFDAMAANGAPISDRDAAIFEAMVRGLKTDGVWTALDTLYCLFSHAQKAMEIDFIKPSRKGAFVNSPTVTPYRNMQGNGTSSYFDMNYNPAVDAVNFAQNNATFGIWRHTATAAAASLGGFYSGSAGITIIPAASNFTNRINTGTSAGNQGQTSVRGLYAVSRTASNASTPYVNGTGLTTSTAAGAAVVSNNLYIGRGSASSYSNQPLSLGFAGRALTATEHSRFYQCMLTVQRAVGAES